MSTLKRKVLQCDSHCKTTRVVVAKKMNDDVPADALIRAARAFSGDAAQDAVPLSGKERRLMDEIRAEYRRPSAAEIKRMAKDLAAQTKKQS